MNIDVSKKNVLVLGAGHGVGACISDCFVREGCRVCGIAKTPTGFTDKDRQDLWKTTQSFSVIKDMLPDIAPNELFNSLQASHFEPDIIIHCLGGIMSYKPPYSLDNWRELYRLNFEISLQVNNLFLPHLIQQKWGRVIHISSIAGLEFRGPVPYCIDKAILSSYVRSMGCQLAPTGVVLSAILPGAMENTNEHNSIKNESLFFKESQKLGRYISFSEISSLIIFLCSDLINCHVGSVFPVDGGLGRSFFSM